MTGRSHQKRDFRWTAENIAAAKQSIKKELSTPALKKHPQKRLQYISRRIETLGEDTSSKATLSRFIFIISALVHHQKYSGLRTSQIHGLTKVAHAILLTQGLTPASSNLIGLFGDLHTILSQIFRNEGRQWKAAWEQQLSFQHSKSNPSGGQDFQTLSKGLRNLRLGYSKQALLAFEEADRLSPETNKVSNARIARIKTLRLANQDHEAKALIQSTLKSHALEPELKAEITWESTTLDLKPNYNLDAMMACVKKDSSHYSAIYLLEAFFWSAMVADMSWMKKFSKISNLSRKRELALPSVGLFYKCALEIENCYDTSIPLLVRQNTLGEILENSNKLISIDRELLVLGSAIRWLTRSKAFSLAALTLSRYESLSLILTNARERDCLGCLQDLFEKPWYQKNTLPKSA